MEDHHIISDICNKRSRKETRSGIKEVKRMGEFSDFMKEANIGKDKFVVYKYEAIKIYQRETEEKIMNFRCGIFDVNGTKTPGNYWLFFFNAFRRVIKACTFSLL
jgi:hypothetical protein